VGSSRKLFFITTAGNYMKPSQVMLQLLVNLYTKEWNQIIFWRRDSITRNHIIFDDISESGSISVTPFIDGEWEIKLQEL